MTSTMFKPTVYLKEGCPFCLKVRIFLLESDLVSQVEKRDFVEGSPEETEIRAELGAHLEKVSFPAAQIEQGRYIADSDGIVASLARIAGRDPVGMTVYRNYVHGVFAMAMQLWKENADLKKAATGG